MTSGTRTYAAQRGALVLMFLLGLLLLPMVACQSFPEPDTPAKQLSLAEAAFTSVVEGLDNYKDQTPSDVVEDIKSYIRTVDKALDEAHKHIDSDIEEFDRQLAVANSTIAVMSTILKEFVDGT